MKNLYKTIRAARKAANLTQGDVAKSCNVSRNAVTQWESLREDGRTEPTLSSLVALSVLTGVGVSELVGQEMPVKHLSELEKSLLAAFRGLNSKDKAKAHLYVDALTVMEQAESSIVVDIPKSSS